ncbi:TonB-dependent receptor [Aureivirga marina]|uniref:TonB-dependent receptor n=1 Tax=Aureivirga marina TaxID=1182451 RepID=UPI0018CA3D23|nr:carboxypeptidase regulatory-like domain-containing protein [Aureivirga marina]
MIKRFGLIIFLMMSTFVIAQETTGTLQGTVKDDLNLPIEEATILVTDTETNFRYGGSSNQNGFYIINNLPPSKKYKIEVSFLGFQTIIITDFAVNLGEISYQDFVLNEDNVSLGEVEVKVNKTTNKKGNETLLTAKTLQKTPTISRSIQDLTKNLPESNLNSFAGASNRFNNLNIDGIANNDVVGFQEPASGAAGSSANGTPGSLSRSQPIGLGAIKELSVKVAPFDVSIGNFTGANINLVTKNGTNDFRSEVYGYGNNQLLVGKYAEGIKQKIEDFYDVQIGASFGGALKKDKLFFFVNFEQALSNTPVLNAPGSSSSNISLETVEAISQKLINDYGYDPGTYTDANIKTASSKLFARLDYNISDVHKLTVRNNFVKSYADNLEWNASVFNFGNQGYRHESIANSLALELKSNFSNGISNVFSFGYNKVKEDRNFDGRIFPHIDISENSNSIFAGTYREASVYGTDLNTFQVSNKLSVFKDNHSLTFGGFAQYNTVDYGFLSAWNGRWQYKSVDNFLNDRPSRIRGVYHISNNTYDFVSNEPSATLKIFEGAVYAQDYYRVSDRFSVLAGARLDFQFLTEDLPISQEVKNTPEFAHFTNKISKAPQFNPRLGFNYFIDQNRNFKLRGGTGLFSGRIPYLWFAYAEYISGTEYFNIDIRPDGTQTIVENLGDLASQQPNLTEINLIDNDFKLPREWKSNLALEVRLPNEWNLSLEGTYSKVINGIFFQSINRKDEKANFSGADGREYFTSKGEDIKINKNFTNVFLLTNTDQGYRYNVTFGVNKTYRNYNGYIGYTYGKSKDISSTVRNSNAANFEWNQAIDANNPDLSYSNFDLRHKIVSSHSFNFNLNEKNNLLVSLLYTGTSGSPYSFIYAGDVNQDGSSKNDLLYVPASANEINLRDITDASGNVVVSAEQQWENLDRYISGNDYLSERRGKYAERNGAKTPWNHQLDMKWEYTTKLNKGKALSFSFDMLNVLNFINNDWGRLVYVPNVVNSSFSLIDFVGIENNQPVYQFNNITQTPWVVDQVNSRWKAQVGVRYQF